MEIDTIPYFPRPQLFHHYLIPFRRSMNWSIRVEMIGLGPDTYLYAPVYPWDLKVRWCLKGRVPASQFSNKQLKNLLSIHSIQERKVKHTSTISYS